MQYLFLISVLSILALSNYYVGQRGQQFLFLWSNPRSLMIYWGILVFLASAYILGRILEGRVPSLVSSFFFGLGSYWLAFLFYLVLFLWGMDLLRLTVGKTAFFQQSPLALGFIMPRLAVIAVLALVVFGTWNAWNTAVVHYNIHVPNQTTNLKEINIVMVSDLHLGTFINNWRLPPLVEHINRLKPDIVFLPGDVIDVRLDALEEEQLAAYLRRIESPYGVYAVLGNHEYLSGTAEDIQAFHQKAGVKLLQDSWVEIPGGFYIVGRDEYSRKRWLNSPRRELEEVMHDIDHHLPIILLDHQPVNLYESLAAGVDLQVSGHSHRGQLKPLNLITAAIFEIDHGHLVKEDLQIIVSSGYGVWGPPIRIGSQSEIVSINLQFTPFE